MPFLKLFLHFHTRTAELGSSWEEQPSVSKILLRCYEGFPQVFPGKKNLFFCKHYIIFRDKMIVILLPNGILEKYQAEA